MKYICTENYEINVGENVVEAVSKEYIPFDPKDWRKDFRDNLRQALKDTLSADAHSKLFASYSGPSVGVADLDNILFYNIGASCFQSLKVTELLMEVGTPSEKEEFPHKYLYRVVDELPALSWTKDPKNLIVRWDCVKFEKKQTFNFWLALVKSNNIVEVNPLSPGQRFGVEIFLTLPMGEKINLASVVKPLLDGTICAFHGADSAMHEQADSVAGRLRIPKELLLQTKNVLGKTCFARLGGIQHPVIWNPQDDRCMAVRLAVMRRGDQRHEFSGKIYALEG